MKIKIQYNTESDENEIISFRCVPENKVNRKNLQTDEILIDCSEVPPEFYAKWFEYVIKEKKLVWSSRRFVEQPLWSNT